uniref:Uncharacterized protein n=1 Tax=Trichuris muris TaxID=70415 RepID=A0A5S6QZ53_TRIMR
MRVTGGRVRNQCRRCVADRPPKIAADRKWEPRNQLARQVYSSWRNVAGVLALLSAKSAAPKRSPECEPRKNGSPDAIEDRLFALSTGSAQSTAVNDARPVAQEKVKACTTKMATPRALGSRFGPHFLPPYVRGGPLTADDQGTSPGWGRESLVDTGPRWDVHPNGRGNRRRVLALHGRQLHCVGGSETRERRLRARFGTICPLRCPEPNRMDLSAPTEHWHLLNAPNRR